MKPQHSFVVSLFLFSSACATTGGGPLGIVAFDPDQHVSSAEPLFGKGDMACLDDPTFLLTLYTPQRVETTTPDIPQRVEATKPAICGKMRSAISAALPEMKAPMISGGNERYSPQQRNEVIDAIMASSDRKCGRYIAFLQQYDANVNSTFGIAAQAAATLAAIATGGTAQALAAAASIAGGSRNTLNQSHFNNQTIGVLANAFENKRADQRVEIAEREGLTSAKYTLMRGIADATRYHANCSIVVGLKEAQRSVEEARSPSLATMEAFLTSLQKVRGQMKALLDVSEPTSAKDAGKPAAAAGAKAAGSSDPVASPVD